MTAGILITPLKPNPPFVQTSELSQGPLPPEKAVSAFSELELKGASWLVSAELALSLGSLGFSGMVSPLK